jgi:predicted O-methyltransferase YrrM
MRIVRVVDVIRRIVRDADSTAQSLRETVAGIANQTDLLNRKFEEVVVGIKHQSDLLNRKLDRLIEVVSGRPERSDGASAGAPDALPAPPASAASRSGESETLRQAMERIPLLLADRTYNTSHPEYDARTVRNFPGKILNLDRNCDNPAFRALLRLAKGQKVDDPAWGPVLAAAREEVRSVPHAQETFERQRAVEQYMRELGAKYRAHYVPGWVNLDDALFLYWLVRQARPRTIVQTGVCNGLSSAFMMLALAKNGPDGRLHAIDLPPVFDPNDPAWIVPGKVYGVVIPEGKGSGSLVPDAYRERFALWNGDARELMPRMVDELASIDFFYHDSDHTYDHMMFEFRQARRKLARGGLVVADDISWNASLWDFADEHKVPAYNFKGSVGAAFL